MNSTLKKISQGAIKFSTSSPWNTLTFATANYASSWLLSRLRKKSKPYGDIKFVSNTAYKSVYAHWAKLEIQKAARKAIYEKYAKRNKERLTKQRASVLEKQLANRKYIIENSVSKFDDSYGIVNDTNYTFKATDRWGRIVKESLMIYYEGEDDIQVSVTKQGTAIATDTSDATTNGTATSTITTKKVLFYDVAPTVSVSSGKNIVMTQVQGRDYTRKEMVSGGDLTFSVSGNIASDLAAIAIPSADSKDKFNPVIQYPEESVQRFIQIMQHPGIIKVNHFLFKMHNVDKIIIKDFRLEQPQYKNLQPYSFTCVAVEPDEEVTVLTDTITELSYIDNDETVSDVEKQIMANKLKEISVGTSKQALADGVTWAIDKLTPGI